MATENDINTLLQQLDISEELLRFNTTIENDITKNSGKVIYSYNNMIIASEISDEYYTELAKNPLIESIYVVPLKRYGDIDTKLIDQLDITKIQVAIFGTSETNDTSGNNGTSGINGTSGGSGSSGNQSGSNVVPPVVGVKPIITSSLIITGLTVNTLFTYKIVASGTTPITYQMTPHINGPVSIEGDTIKGMSVLYGKFNIEIKAINAYGMDTKSLIIRVPNPPRITSSLSTTGATGTNYSYQLTANAAVTYWFSGVASISGLTANTNTGIISGTPAKPGRYSIAMSVSNSDGVDYKNMMLNVAGVKPIITSSSIAEGNKGIPFYYQIWCTGVPTPTFNIVGSLPNGLSFKTNYIDGTPTEICKKSVLMQASNSEGSTTRNLVIEIRKST
jgi:hypothetical protein